MKRLLPVLVLDLFLLAGCSLVSPADRLEAAAPPSAPPAGAPESPAEEPPLRPGPAQAAPTEWRRLGPEGAAEYEVRHGDSLSEIAQARLGSMLNLPLILMANPEINDPARIIAGQTIRLPGADYFAAPFLLAGERAERQQLLRHSTPAGEGYLGLYLSGKAPVRARFIAVQARGGRVRMIFNSAEQALTGPGWSWRAVDLDGDGGLDLVGWNPAVSGGGFGAWAFHRQGEAWRRHALADGNFRGGFAEDRPLYRNRQFIIRGVREVAAAPGQSRREGLELCCQWDGREFSIAEQ